MKPFICIIAAVLLTGCSTFETKNQVVTTAVTQKSHIPEFLLEPCVATTPPSAKGYAGQEGAIGLLGEDKLVSIFESQEKILIEYIAILLRDLKLCSGRITEIKEFEAKENSKQ